jgi:hypothetical protein
MRPPAREKARGKLRSLSKWQAAHSARGSPQLQLGHSRSLRASSGPSEWPSGVGPVEGPYRPPDCHRQLDQISVDRGAGHPCQWLHSREGQSLENLQCNLLKDWRRSDYSVNQSTLTASHPACLEALYQLQGLQPARGLLGSAHWQPLGSLSGLSLAGPLARCVAGLW